MPRFEELVAPSHWRTVDFLSDLHLQASEPDTLAAWHHYLQTTPADALFILGDLFEVWVGDDALDDPGSFESQACALLQAASRQRALFFLHGNRDFLIGPGFARHTGATLLHDPTVLVWQGQRLLLSHHGKAFRDQLRHVFTRCVAFLHQRVLANALAQRKDFLFLIRTDQQGFGEFHSLRSCVSSHEMQRNHPNPFTVGSLISVCR